jgi:hypothetical protein
MEATEKVPMSHIKKGFIAASILITFDVVGYFLHYREKIWEPAVLGCILLFSVGWACIQFSRESQNPLTFSTVFTHGFKMTALITGLWFLYTLMAINIFFPGSIDDMVNNAIAEARKRPDYSEERMKQNFGMARTVMKAILLSMTVIVTLVVGVIGDLIGSLAAQNMSRSSSQITK